MSDYIGPHAMTQDVWHTAIDHMYLERQKDTLAEEVPTGTNARRSLAKDT